MKSIPDSNNSKRKPGRPATGIGKAMGLRLYPDLEIALDAYIEKQKEPMGRPEAIRRILNEYLRRRGMM